MKALSLRANRLQFAGSFCLLFFTFCWLTPLFGEIQEEIQKHKAIFIEQICQDPLKVSNPAYPLERVLLTIRANDADYIPKVPQAGVVFENGSYQLMHNGIKILKDCYYGAWMTDIIYGLKGHHEPQEEKVFYEVLKYIPANATMIELGAYWAYYSLWFSTAIAGAKNYLIEPDPIRMSIGEKNFQLNNRSGVFYRGYVCIRDNDGANYNGANRILIDSFLKDAGIEHVNILHSDIQGAEYEMLLSCSEAIKKGKIDYFFISTHSDLIHDGCLNFLLGNNYQIIAEHRMSESCSYDGLIVAKRKNVFGPEKIAINKYHP